MKMFTLLKKVSYYITLLEKQTPIYPKGWFTLRHKHKHKNFAHVYLHSVIQDGGPRRRGRIDRNTPFYSCA